MAIVDTVVGLEGTVMAIAGTVVGIVGTVMGIGTVENRARGSL